MKQKKPTKEHTMDAKIDLTFSNLLIERIQNFAIKVISDGHHKKRDSVTPLRKALNMLTFKKLYELRFACHIFKIVNNIFPHWYQV